MKKRYSFQRCVLSIIAGVLCACALFACELKTYSGTLSVRGNAPFTKLVLQTADGTLYELTGEKAKDLTIHQYRRISIAGKEIAPQKGPGFPAKIEVVRIISIRDK